MFATLLISGKILAKEAISKINYDGKKQVLTLTEHKTEHQKSKNN